MNNRKYDIVFWSHVSNGIERVLPLMSSFKKKGVEPLLFYQNYDFHDGLSAAQIKIANTYGLDIVDYSFFMRRDIILKIVTVFVKLFKAIGLVLLYNKFIGLRSKLLQQKIDERFIRDMVLKLSPKIGFFDNISLMKPRVYPYGSYYIKKASDELGIRSFDIFNGLPNPPVKLLKRRIDFERYYVPHQHEKEKYFQEHIGKDEPILVFGDPRFDANWKEKIKKVFSEDVRKNIERMHIESKVKILYVCPNLECVGEENEKYRNMSDIIKATKELTNAALLIKPHPRYPHIDKIKDVARSNKFNNFFILKDDPLTCYLDEVDFVISLTTSALFDVLPEGYEKVLIYDRGDFCKSVGVINIFDKKFTYLNSYEELLDFLRNRKRRDFDADSFYGGDKNIHDFCKRWVAGGNELNSIVENMSEDILCEFKKSEKE